MNLQFPKQVLLANQFEIGFLPLAFLVPVSTFSYTHLQFHLERRQIDSLTKKEGI
jgi:hypothetical protein